MKVPSLGTRARTLLNVRVDCSCDFSHSFQDKTLLGPSYILDEPFDSFLEL